MFETFEEKYIELEKKYDQKDYDGVVRDGGKTVESLVAFVFRTFPSTLKTVKQKQLFVEFENKFQTEKGNRFLDFIERPTIGVSIGYYFQLCKQFSNEDHNWLKTNIKSALDTANSIRNKFAHSRPGDVKPGDDDASDMLDAFEIIVDELALRNETPDSLGIPLASYLIYSSIKHSFDEIAQKEEDYKKIISDSKKIIPQLFEHLFYSKYYEVSIEEKESFFSNDELWSKNENQSSAYEDIFSKIEFGKLINTKDKVDDVIDKYLKISKEKYDRRGVKPYTKLLDVLVRELADSKYKNYLKYAVTVKNKYLHKNEINDTERIELKSSAKSLNITSKTAYRIEQEVISVIDNELTLYQTLQSVSEEADPKSVSQNENILIEMIKKGTPENIVVSMAESLNFECDVYHLLSKFGNRKTKPEKKKIEEEENIDLKKKKEDSIPEDFGDVFKNLFGGGSTTPKEKSNNNKEEAKTYYEEAVKSFENKNYEESITNFTKAIEIEEKEYSYFHYRGLCYYSLEKYDIAIHDFTKAINLYSQDANTFINRGLCYNNLKDYHKAIQDFTKSIEINPKQASVYNYRGNCYYYLKEYDKAIQDYNEAIKLNKNNFNFFYNKGNCLYAKKKYNEAIINYSKATLINPKFAPALNGSGNCHYNLKNYSDSIKYYDLALSFEPNADYIKQNKKNALDQKEKSNGKTEKKEEKASEEMADILSKAFGSGAFGGGTQQTNTAPDIKIKVPLTLEEISTGVTKNFQYKKFEKCSACDGKGSKNIDKSKTCSACSGTGKITKTTKSFLGDIKTEVECEKCAGFGFEDVKLCPACNGEGRIEKAAKISVDFPAGMSQGQFIRVKGNGNAGRRGTEIGDLLCEVDEIKHEHFTRENENLFYDLYINKNEAAKGIEVRIPILNGKIKLKIPAGIETGKMLKIAGKGLPKLNSEEKGDLFVKINVK